MKPFSWSWSKLKNYRTCPKRHYEIDLAKNYKEGESEPLKWGNLLHNSMAAYIEKDAIMPTMVSRYRQWPDNVKKLKALPGVEVTVENKMAIAQDFTATAFFDAATWFRAVIDVKIILPPEMKTAITIDWKTGGSVNPEFEQLALSSQVIFANYPEIEQVGSIYVWFGHDTQTIKVYRREDMVPMWNELWPMINEMTEAYRTTTYPPKPSGLCKSYCPVVSCPYHGKGSQ